MNINKNMNRTTNYLTNIDFDIFILLYKKQKYFNTTGV